MGGSHHTAAHFSAEFNNGHGQSRALSRVSAGTQLIEQHQSTVIALLYNIHNGTHMAGECRQALCNRLLITDIRQNRVEGGKFTAVTGRHMEAALSHQCQQANGLQGDGLTAGVRTGDNHGIKISTQAKRNRHYGLGIDQWMPCITKLHNARIIHDGCPSTHAITQFRLGENHIQPNQHGKIQINGFRIRGSLRGKLRQDPFDFLFFLKFQFPQCIIGIDRGHGLYEIGGTGGGNIMHQAGNVIFTFGFHRHHITAVPNGDDGFPEELGISGRRNHFLQRITNLGRLDPHMAANIRQSRRCVIRNLFFGQNRAEDLIFQVFIGGQGRK